MKFISNLLMLLALTLGLNAQWISGTTSTNALVLDSNAGQLAMITLSDISGSANQVILFDSSTTATNITLPAYTGRQYYTTNQVRTWTNSLGVSQSTTNTVLFSAPLSVASATVGANRLYSVNIPANGSVVLEPPGNLGYTYGLLLRTTGNVTYNARLVDR